MTALMFASVRAHPEVVKLLLEGGANVNARNKVSPLLHRLDRCYDFIIYH
jgi:ankyrin repeat protein